MLSKTVYKSYIESSLFKYRLPSNTPYFRYIEDILIFLPENIKVEEIAEKLNNIEPSISVIDEKESNSTKPLLDILIIKSQNQLSKSTANPQKKNDYIHFHIHHNHKSKTGLIIGFYLRDM